MVTMEEQHGLYCSILWTPQSEYGSHPKPRVCCKEMNKASQLERLLERILCQEMRISLPQWYSVQLLEQQKQQQSNQFNHINKNTRLKLESGVKHIS